MNCNKNMHLLRFFILLLSLPSLSSALLSSHYLSPTTLFTNYQHMLKSFKIFIYTAPPSSSPPRFTSAAETLFFSLLLNSSFLTNDPEDAHLFFIPLPFSTLSTRSTSRAISELRRRSPYWNRALGADHFLLSCSGLPQGRDRNVAELKKNSLLISCFPSTPGNFIPHKDITFPPVILNSHALHALGNKARGYLGYSRYGWVKSLAGDDDVLVESEPSDRLSFEERLLVSKFCLFEYGNGDVSEIGEAMRFGCVPVVITERPIQDLPLMDVLTWREMAVFVRSRGGRALQEVKSVLRRAIEGGRYEEMKGLCETASKHFMWNEKPQPYDAFNMVMYQLWRRRHAIRYVQREWI